MPWQVEIHVIDVGADDSSLIVAKDTAAGLLSSVLVDGGLTKSTEIVHDKVLTNLHELDPILMSYYDVDHSLGIVAAAPSAAAAVRGGGDHGLHPDELGRRDDRLRTTTVSW